MVDFIFTLITCGIRQSTIITCNVKFYIILYCLQHLQTHNKLLLFVNLPSSDFRRLTFINLYMRFINLNISMYPIIKIRKCNNLFRAKYIHNIISNSNICSISSFNSLIFLQCILFITMGTPVTNTFFFYYY